ncbi:CynX/NimT family MFS transporter [Arthrobacter sulfonylureivorans]|uniref:MFS transporter n=1 Tax=Arthrobacter sulfonylureivorans TaxID=2486855 RepID=A0ABY3W7X6_9MICC|nr:MFS transporter [Arthrobacter sulfonylureivorans]UNK45592.1 MFS transporter [Arthrobacter sulfonylureivorans]
MKEPATDRVFASRPSLPWVVLGIAMLAVNLRAPIIAPTAVLGEIQADLGLTAAGAGLLTGLPVLLFALATPLATRTIRRWGPEATVLLCLGGVLAGTVIRSLGPAAVVFAGTAIIGVALTLGNIVVPVLIRRDVPWNRVSAVTGAYSAIMNVGSMAALLGTAPLAALVGWRWALAAWAVVVIIGLAYWLPTARRRREALQPDRSAASDKPSAHPAAAGGRGTDGPGTPIAPASKSLRGRSNRWIVAMLTVAFCGQSAAYYATTTWLPLLLSDVRGLSSTASGASASLFQVAAIVGALGVPLLAARTRLWVPTASIAVLWISLPIGLLLAPDAYLLWSVTGGIAQGGGFTAIFSVIPRVARTDQEAATASARIQTGGYLAATCAPPVAGWLNTLTGGWTAPLFLVLALVVAFGVAGLSAVQASERRYRLP